MNSTDHFSNKFLFNYIDDKSILERNVEVYPVSSLARFLLWRHYLQNDDPAIEDFSHQSALFFNNPDWVRFQLHQNVSTLENKKSGPFISTEHFAVTLPQNDSFGEKESVALDEVEISVVEENQNTLENNEGITEENDLIVEPVNFDEEDVINREEETTLMTSWGNENITEDATPTPATHEIGNEIENEETEEEISMTSWGNENITEDAGPIPATHEIGDEIDKTKTDLAETDEIPGKNEIGETATIDALSETQLSYEEKILPPESVISDVQNTTLSEADENEELAFEPLHTVDYFASQGIKIKEEQLTNDKLGKQVKSFTNWLKTMKKLHPGKLPEQNEVIERIIQSSAEQSNADAEILTEAMAEVLIKQDKKEKAMEMYQKLSLMNPSKSAYFAAKIESLKNQ